MLLVYLSRNRKYMTCSNNPQSFVYNHNFYTAPTQDTPYHAVMWSNPLKVAPAGRKYKIWVAWCGHLHFQYSAFCELASHPPHDGRLATRPAKPMPIKANACRLGLWLLNLYITSHEKVNPMGSMPSDFSATCNLQKLCLLIPTLFKEFATFTIFSEVSLKSFLQQD